jgi:hypothetical protein
MCVYGCVYINNQSTSTHTHTHNKHESHPNSLIPPSIPFQNHTQHTGASKRRKKASSAESEKGHEAPAAAKGKGSNKGKEKEKEKEQKKTEELPPAPPATWVQVCAWMW